MVNTSNTFELLNTLDERMNDENMPGIQLSNTTNVAKSVDLGHNVNEVQQINENAIHISVKPLVTNTQLASSSLFAEEDSDGDMKNVYDKTGTFMASGSGYGTKNGGRKRMMMIHLMMILSTMLMIYPKINWLSVTLGYQDSRSEEFVGYVLSRLSQM